MKATPKNLKLISLIAKKLGVLNIWIPCDNCRSLNLEPKAIGEKSSAKYIQFICRDCDFSGMFYMFGRFDPNAKKEEEVKPKAKKKK